MQVIPSIDLAGRSLATGLVAGRRLRPGCADRPTRAHRPRVRGRGRAGHPPRRPRRRARRAAGRAWRRSRDVSRAVAVPLQVAGGVDGPDQIELCFAAGATRVVRAAVGRGRGPRSTGRLPRRSPATGWRSGLDARPERLRDYPWKRFLPPTLDEVVEELAGAGRPAVRAVPRRRGARPGCARPTVRAWASSCWWLAASPPSSRCRPWPRAASSACHRG